MISFTPQNHLEKMEIYFGFAAAFCTTIAFVPQAIKVYKTKHTKDISLVMFLLMNLGIVLWLIYGLMLNSYPIIIANAVTIVLAFYILARKIKLDFVDQKKVEL